MEGLEPLTVSFPLLLFQSGDRATVSVLSSCSCDEVGSLNWIVAGRSQFLNWGTQDESKEIETEADGKVCEFNFK